MLWVGIVITPHMGISFIPFMEISISPRMKLALMMERNRCDRLKWTNFLAPEETTKENHQQEDRRGNPTSMGLCPMRWNQFFTP